MRTVLTKMLGCEYPVMALSHCRDVVAAVTNSGGFGVFGADPYSPEELDMELAWIDEHTHGRPYGVDVLIPATHAQTPREDLIAVIPRRHREFADGLLASFDVPPLPDEDTDGRRRIEHAVEDRRRQAGEHLVVALSHPGVRLIASALGPPPAPVVEQAHAAGVIVAALVGAKQHVARQRAAGVDLLVATGCEAGGHTGDIATMVLVPDVVEEAGDLPVVAAGGIARGAQVAAAMALGAVGVWTGSVWLTTRESGTHPMIQRKLLAASSSDTVRSRDWSGKPCRHLRSAWTDAWDAPENPDPLPYPPHWVLATEARVRIERASFDTASGAYRLLTYPVGQVVGTMTAVRSVRQILLEMMDGLADTVLRLGQEDGTGDPSATSPRR